MTTRDAGRKCFHDGWPLDSTIWAAAVRGVRVYALAAVQITIAAAATVLYYCVVVGHCILSVRDEVLIVYFLQSIVRWAETCSFAGVGIYAIYSFEHQAMCQE